MSWLWLSVVVVVAIVVVPWISRWTAVSRRERQSSTTNGLYWGPANARTGRVRVSQRSDMPADAWRDLEPSRIAPQRRGHREVAGVDTTKRTLLPAP